MSIDHSFKINKILLVDDEPSICESLQGYLEDAGYEVSVAYNGQEALDYLGVFDADLVILDLYMPAMNGHEVLLRLAESHPELPKLVISGICDESIRLRALDEGAWDYLQKPVTDLSILDRKILSFEERYEAVRVVNC